MSDFKELLKKRLEQDQEAQKSYKKIVKESQDELSINIKKLKESVPNEDEKKITR